MIKKRLIIACDLDPRSGEGRLAHLFIEQMGLNKDDNDCLCLTPNTEADSSKTSAIPGRRLIRYWGVYLWLWLEILKYRRCQQTELFILNYLPIWNFVTFLIIPRSARLAPLTGGPPLNSRHLYTTYHHRCIQSVLRNVVLTALSKLSGLIIKIRRLNVKPATPFVSEFLEQENSRHFYITTSLTPLKAKRVNQNQNRYDLIAYTNDHPLKNNQLLKNLLPLFAQKKMRVALIAKGNCVNDFSNSACDLFENISQDDVAELMQKSNSALICSLEGAGLFAQEAAVLGLKIFCFPDTGASFLPGSEILCKKKDRPSVSQIADDVASKAHCSPNINTNIEMAKFVNEAKDYFTSDNR